MFLVSLTTSKCHFQRAITDVFVVNDLYRFVTEKLLFLFCKLLLLLLLLLLSYCSRCVSVTLHPVRPTLASRRSSFG